jgi:hypothetical protein
MSKINAKIRVSLVALWSIDLFSFFIRYFWGPLFRFYFYFSLEERQVRQVRQRRFYAGFLRLALSRLSRFEPLHHRWNPDVAGANRARRRCLTARKVATVERLPCAPA